MEKGSEGIQTVVWRSVKVRNKESVSLCCPVYVRCCNRSYLIGWMRLHLNETVWKAIIEIPFTLQIVYYVVLRRITITKTDVGYKQRGNSLLP